MWDIATRKERQQFADHLELKEAFLQTGGDIPDQSGAVVAAGNQGLAVGRPSH